MNSVLSITLEPDVLQYGAECDHQCYAILGVIKCDQCLQLAIATDVSLVTKIDTHDIMQVR